MGVTTIAKAYGKTADKRRDGLPSLSTSRLTVGVLIVLIIASALFVPKHTSDAQTAESERAALVALYNATDGPNWNININ